MVQSAPPHGREGAVLGRHPGQLGGLRGGRLVVPVRRVPDGAEGESAGPVDHGGTPRTGQPHGFQQALVDSGHTGLLPYVTFGRVHDATQRTEAR